MEKLYLWFNPKRQQVYHKLCRNSDTPIGSMNQYGHILLTTLTIFNDKVYSDLTYRQCYRIMAKNRNKRYKRLLNRFENKSERRVSLWEKRH